MSGSPGADANSATSSRVGAALKEAGGDPNALGPGSAQAVSTAVGINKMKARMLLQRPASVFRYGPLEPRRRRRSSAAVIRPTATAEIPPASSGVARRRATRLWSGVSVGDEPTGVAAGVDVAAPAFTSKISVVLNAVPLDCASRPPATRTRPSDSRLAVW